MKTLKESEKDKKIRLLRKENYRLSDELAVQKAENIKLQERINELVNPYNANSKARIEGYETALLSQIEEVKKMKEEYSSLIKRQRAYIQKEKDKYKKATKKAIKELNESLS